STTAPKDRSRLLDLHLGAGFGQLLGDFVGGLLGDVLDDVLRSAFDQVLGFLQAEVRTDAADFLDDVDLLVAAVQQDDGELGLLFTGFGGGSATGAAGRHGHGDRS